MKQLFLDSLQLDVQKHAMLTAYLVFFGLVAFFCAKRFGFFKLPEHHKRTQRYFIADVIAVFSIYIAAQVIIVPMFFVIFAYLFGYGRVNSAMLEGDPYLNTVFNISLVAGTAICLLIYCFILNPNTIQEVFRSNLKPIWRDIKNFFFGVVTWLVAFPVAIGIGHVVGLFVLVSTNATEVDQVAVHELKKSLNYPLLSIMLTTTIVLFVPIVEELLFRGFLQTWLVDRIGRTAGIIMASLIFSFFHYSSQQGYANIELLTSLFILSCFLGYIYERQQSLFAPIGLHAAFNGISALMIVYQT